MKNRRSGGLTRAAFVSAGVHVVLIFSAWFLASQQTAIPPMRVYAVNIVSPPPQASGEPSPAVPEPEPEEEPEPEPEPVEEEPEPEPAPAPPPPPPPPQQQARSTPPPPPQRQPEPEPEPEPQPERPREEPRPSTGRDPDPTSPGGDNINLRLQGVECPSPAYCENIVTQLQRYFRAPAGARGEAEVYFVINRDGSIRDVRLLRSTGTASFRIAVMEAVEQAGRNDEFGPLPAGFNADQLPVSFFFRPVQ